MFPSQLVLLLFLFIRITESIYVNSKELNVEQVADYTDLSLLQRKTANVRDTFLKQKQQKDILRNFDRLVSSNSIYIDGISHYEVTASSQKVRNIEEDFKSLISMHYMKYEYLRDAHWRSWRELKDPNGNLKIISYKCQSIVHENCTGCEGKGVWVIEEGTPPCPYEIFSLKNNNELCVAKFTDLNKKISACPSIIKYAELTKTCNNPIVTRWRFTRNYKITGRYSSVICNGRDFCEFMTLYQIYPEYVIFRILNSNNIIFSRVMRNDNKSFACTVNCGVMDFNTFEVSQSKGNVINLLPSKAKRQNKKMPKKYKENIYSTSNVRPNIGTNSSALYLHTVPTTHRRFILEDSNNTILVPNKETITKKNSKLDWVRTETGYYLKNGLPIPIPIGTTQTYKRLREKGEHSTYYDSYEDIKEKFRSFY